MFTWDAPHVFLNYAKHEVSWQLDENFKKAEELEKADFEEIGFEEEDFEGEQFGK